MPQTLRGYHSTALSHIDGGVKIVSELQSHHSTESSLHLSHTPYVPLPILNQIFMRLDTQASQLGIAHRKHLLCQQTSTKDSGYNPDIPHSFSSLEEARNSLDYIRICADRTALSLPFSPPNRQTVTSFSPAVIAETKLSLDLIRNFSAIRLNQWSSVFESFLRDKRDLTVIEQRAARILELHRLVMGVHLSIDLFRVVDDEMVWDEHCQEFKTVVAQAEIVLQLLPGSKRPSFTFDTEVILPLASTVIKCRDGQVRRKAIALLRSAHRQEGIWNSLLTARVAERVMEIEEDELDGEMGSTMSIPRWNRVLAVQIKLDNENRRANLQYVKPKEDGRMETVDEWLEWPGLGAQ
jgi:hypothetical protein